MKLISFLILLCLTGCVNMTQRPHVDDLTARDSHYGEDCIPMLLGVGIGTATVEHAMASAYVRKSLDYYQVYQRRFEPIDHIRPVEISDYQFLGFGARCIEVTGEPDRPFTQKQD